jgi:hypothetical protein
MTVLQRSGIDMTWISIWLDEIVIEANPGVHEFLMVINIMLFNLFAIAEQLIIDAMIL